MYLKPSSLSLPLSEGLSDDEHVLYWPGDHSTSVTLFSFDSNLPTGLREVAAFEVYLSLRQDFLSHATQIEGPQTNDAGSGISSVDTELGGPQ